MKLIKSNQLITNSSTELFSNYFEVYDDVSNLFELMFGKNIKKCIIVKTLLLDENGIVNFLLEWDEDAENYKTNIFEQKEFLEELLEFLKKEMSNEDLTLDDLEDFIRNWNNESKNIEKFGKEKTWNLYFYITKWLSKKYDDATYEDYMVATNFKIEFILLNDCNIDKEKFDLFKNILKGIFEKITENTKEVTC